MQAEAEESLRSHKARTIRRKGDHGAVFSEDIDPREDKCSLCRDFFRPDLIPCIEKLTVVPHGLFFEIASQRIELLVYKCPAVTNAAVHQFIDKRCCPSVY